MSFRYHTSVAYLPMYIYSSQKVGFSCSCFGNAVSNATSHLDSHVRSYVASVDLVVGSRRYVTKKFDQTL